jgi:phosphate acetyltransferase
MNKPENQAKTLLAKRLIDVAARNPAAVGFPEGEDDRIPEAARLLIDWGVVSSVHYWSSKNSLWKDGHLGLCVQQNPQDLWNDTFKHVQQKLLAKKKLVPDDDIRKLALNPLYQAGTQLACGEVDVVLAGSIATTADVIRAALATVGLAPSIRTISGCFILDRETPKEETLLFADAAVVIEPNVDQLVDTAASSAKTWEQLQSEPARVAFLSFSTHGSASHPKATMTQEAVALFAKKFPQYAVDGELQFDAAYDPSVAQRKAPGSTVAGRANCYVFPDLNSGNISYKIAQRLGGFTACGPVLQGMAKPFSDLSRGASVYDIALATVVNICLARQK